MQVSENKTIVDLAFDLFGSLAGVPALLDQMPVGERVGFSSMPEVYEDTQDIGQTWTPDIAGKTLEVEGHAYNFLAMEKAPYTTNLFWLDFAIAEGEMIYNDFVGGNLVD